MRAGGGVPATLLAPRPRPTPFNPLPTSPCAPKAQPGAPTTTRARARAPSNGAAFHERREQLHMYEHVAVDGAVHAVVAARRAAKHAQRHRARQRDDVRFGAVDAHGQWVQARHEAQRVALHQRADVLRGARGLDEPREQGVCASAQQRRGRRGGREPASATTSAPPRKAGLACRGPAHTPVVRTGCFLRGAPCSARGTGAAPAAREAPPPLRLRWAAAPRAAGSPPTCTSAHDL